MKHIVVKSSLIFILTLVASQSFAWHDKTHLAVAKVAGLSAWHNAAGADMAKIKAGNVEGYNHFFNNNAEIEVTADMVLNQAERYNKRNLLLDGEGHLYGAIIASLRAYHKDQRKGKYPAYHLAYCAHYIGDLSQPLHNLIYDSYNQTIHGRTDGIVDKNILDEPQNITRHMYDISLSAEKFEEDLAREIARIANISRALAYKLRKENRLITPDEACVQLGHSASLLKAVLQHFP